MADTENGNPIEIGIGAKVDKKSVDGAVKEINSELNKISTDNARKQIDEFVGTLDQIQHALFNASGGFTRLADDASKFGSAEQWLTKFVQSARTLSSIDSNFSETKERISEFISSLSQEQLAEFGAELGHINERIQSFEEDLSILPTSVDRTATANEQLTQTIAALSAYLEQFGDRLDTDALEYLKDSIFTVQSALQDPAKLEVDVGEAQELVNLAVNSMRENLGDLKEPVEEYDSSVEQATTDTEKLAETAGSVKVDGDVQIDSAPIEDATEKADRFGETWEAIKEQEKSTAREIFGIRANVESVVGAMTSGFRSVNSSARKLSSVLTGTLQKGFNKVRSAIDKAFSGRSMKRGLTTLLKYTIGVRSLYFAFRKVRAAIKEGLDNLIKYNGGASETGKRMTELKSSLLYLKNAWAAAFAPILNIVLPILVQFIDKLADVGNAIARIVAQMTGQKQVIQALKTSAGDYADGLDSAGKNAKKASKEQDKLNKKLASFDELNVLGRKEDSSSGASGSGSGVDVKDMFTTIDTPQMDIVQKLLDAWDSADFSKVGEWLSTKLKEGLEGIDWEGIKATVGKIGKSIGTFLKGIFNTEGLTSEIGKSAGEVINTISIFFETLLEETKDIDFGGGLADIFNNFIKTTDWGKVGKNIGEAIKQFLNNISSFLNNINYEDIASGITNFLQGVDWIGVIGSIGGFIGSAIKGASNFISAIANGLSDALMNMDSQDIEEGLNTFIENLDPQGIADALGNLLVSAFKLLFAIGKVAFQIMEIMAKGIGDWFYNMAEEAGADMSDPGQALVEGLFYGIGKALTNAGEWVADNLVAPIVDAFCELLGIHSPSTVFIGFGEDIVAGLKEGLSGIWEAIKGFFVGENGIVTKITKNFNFDNLKSTISTAWDGIKGIFTGFWEKIKAWFSGDTSIVEKIKKNFSFDGLKTTVSTAWENIKKIFTGFWDKIKSWFSGDSSVIAKIKKNFDFSGLQKTVSTAWENIKGKFVGKDSILGKIKSAFEGVGTKIKNAFPDLRSKITEIWGDAKSGKGIVGKLSTAKDKIVEFGKSIKEKFGGIWDGIQSGMKKPLNAIIGFFNIFLSGIAKGFNTIVNTLNNFSFKIPDWVPNIGGSKVGFNLKTISAPSIPYLAQGAVIPPNKEFLAMLGDQSHGTNIEAPLDTIKQAVAEVVGDNNDSEVIRLLEELIATVRNKELKVGDKEIGKANERYQANQRVIKGTAI